MHQQHIGPVAQRPIAALQVENFGAGPVIKRRKGRIAQPAPEEVMGIGRRARIGRGDVRVAQAMRIERRQPGIGHVGHVVVIRHAGVAWIARDMDIQRVVVQWQRVGRQMGLQHPASRRGVEHRDDDVMGQEERIEPGVHLHYRYGCRRLQHQHRDNALGPGRAAFGRGADDDIVGARFQSIPYAAVGMPAAHHAFRPAYQHVWLPRCQKIKRGAGAKP